MDDLREKSSQNDIGEEEEDTLSDDYRMPLAAKDSEWVDVVTCPRSNFSRGHNDREQEEEKELKSIEPNEQSSCSNGSNAREFPLFALFTKLRNTFPEKAIVSKTVSTTDITKSLVGEKPNFSTLRPSAKLLPTKVPLETINETPQEDLFYDVEHEEEKWERLFNEDSIPLTFIYKPNRASIKSSEALGIWFENASTTTNISDPNFFTTMENDSAMNNKTFVNNLRKFDDKNEQDVTSRCENPEQNECNYTNEMFDVLRPDITKKTMPCVLSFEICSIVPESEREQFLVKPNDEKIPDNEPYPHCITYLQEYFKYIPYKGILKSPVEKYFQKLLPLRKSTELPYITEQHSDPNFQLPMSHNQ